MNFVSDFSFLLDVYLCCNVLFHAVNMFMFVCVFLLIFYFKERIVTKKNDCIVFRLGFS